MDTKNYYGTTGRSFQDLPLNHSVTRGAKLTRYFFLESLSMSQAGLFLIEGLLTLAIGVASYAMMPASAVQTKSLVRQNGWFNSSRELSIVVNRVLRDDRSKGDMNNRQRITLSQLWSAITDYHLWPL